MSEAKIIIKNIEGCQKEIMIVEVDGLYYVGAKFDKIGVQRFRYSPSYKTVKGAERYARKRYAA